MVFEKWVEKNARTLLSYYGLIIVTVRIRLGSHNLQFIEE